MLNRMRVLFTLSLLALLIAVGTAIYQSAPEATCAGKLLCLPLPTPTPFLPPQVYLPVVLGGGGAPPPPQVCDVTEVESNDVHADAQVIDHCVRGTAPDDLDMDWYHLDACAGPITLTLQLAGTGDMDLYLYADPPGWPLASSESWGSDESIKTTDLVTGTYYAVVQPALGSQGAYTLTVQATW